MTDAKTAAVLLRFAREVSERGLNMKNGNVAGGWRNRLQRALEREAGVDRDEAVHLSVDLVRRLLGEG